MKIIGFFSNVIGILSIVILLYSCGHSGEHKVLSNIVGNTILLPCNNMLCAVNGRIIESDSLYTPKPELIKFVIYFSETDCTSCAIKNLNIWQDIVNDLKNRGVDFIFIFANTYNTEEVLIESKLNLDHHIYLDQYNMFNKQNYTLLNSSKYNVFLLDRNNKIILLGNPIYNPDLKSLYMNTINNMLAHGGIYVLNEKN